MTDLRDRHKTCDFIDQEQDSVVPDAQPIQSVFPFELLHARRKEILLQTINAAGDLSLPTLGKGCEVAGCRAEELDRVRHGWAEPFTVPTPPSTAASEFALCCPDR